MKKRWVEEEQIEEEQIEEEQIEEEQIEEDNRIIPNLWRITPFLIQNAHYVGGNEW